MYLLGIDVGGTKVNIGLLDRDGKIIVKRDVLIDGRTHSSEILNLVVETLHALCVQKGIGLKEIEHCGIGIPGTVDVTHRIALNVANLGWVNVPIAEEFEQLTGISTNALQDSRAAALGEYMAGVGSDSNVLICITLGTGIGVGMVMYGKIFDGGLGCAGEVSHVPVIANGRSCGCGRSGCLESYAGGKGLGISVEELLGPGASAHTIFDEAKNGNVAAKKIIDEAVVMLGLQFVSIVNLLSPDCMLFSGGLSKQKELFLDPIIAFIKENCYKIAGEKQIKITTSALGSDSPMVGAALFRG
jgi:glucokinase